MMKDFFGRSSSVHPIVDLVDEKGPVLAAQFTAIQIIQMLPTREIARQFVLEELEAASMGNDFAIRFVKASGIDANEYAGSMKNSMPEVDGPGGPQQTLLFLALQLQHDEGVMVEFRTPAIDYVMKHFMLGRYKEKEGSDDSNFDGLPDDDLPY